MEDARQADELEGGPGYSVTGETDRSLPGSNSFYPLGRRAAECTVPVRTARQSRLAT